MIPKKNQTNLCDKNAHCFTKRKTHTNTHVNVRLYALNPIKSEKKYTDCFFSKSWNVEDLSKYVIKPEVTKENMTNLTV